MSKKKFKEGLESVFAPDPVQESEEGRGTNFLRDTYDPEKDKISSVPRSHKSSSKKNFTTDIDSLLQEALQESFDEQLEIHRQVTNVGNVLKVKAFHKKHAVNKRPLTGLDRLIRRTIESSDMNIADETLSSGKKRLVVIFDKEKVEKLKKIARLEKAYLKEILSDLVANFIKEYESKKGSID